MTVEYLKQFSKDLQKINDQSLKDSLLEIIINLKNAEDLCDLSNIKKMKGHS